MPLFFFKYVRTSLQIHRQLLWVDIKEKGAQNQLDIVSALGSYNLVWTQQILTKCITVLQETEDDLCEDEGCDKAGSGKLNVSCKCDGSSAFLEFERNVFGNARSNDLVVYAD